MAGHYCFSVLLSFIYFFVDLTLWILGMMVCLNRAMMVNTIHEILDENAPNLLAMCPSWTEDVASQMRCDTACPVDALQYTALALYSMGAAIFGFLDISYLFSIVGRGCPSTPTLVIHVVAAFSLVVSGHAQLLLAPKMYVFRWQNDGNPFFTETRPSSADGYVSESCSGGYGGGCDYSFNNVVATHDTWCPTGLSALYDAAGPQEGLHIAGIVAFSLSVSFTLAVAVPVLCCRCCPRLGVATVLPAVAAGLFGLVMGGLQFPTALAYILGHACWQYMRLVVNRAAGIDQKQVDTDFKVKPSKDLIPGVVGEPSDSGDGGDAVDAGGYMGY